MRFFRGFRMLFKCLILLVAGAGFEPAALGYEFRFCVYGNIY
jgi:hypothetical protein